MDSRIKDKWQLNLIKWDKIGNKLKKSLIMLFIFTIVVQLLFLFNNEGIPPNNTLVMEGKAIIENPFSKINGEIILATDSTDEISSIIIFINGEKIGCFYDQHITLKVKDKDIIEISGAECKNNNNISIHSVSDNIISPKVGFNYIVNNNMVLVGRVKIKQR